MPWPHVEPFHFADAVAQFPHRHASNGLIVFDGQKQLPIRWSIIARKPVEFLLEALEAKVNVQPICILHEQLPGGKEIVVGFGLDEFHRSVRLRHLLLFLNPLSLHPLLADSIGWLIRLRSRGVDDEEQVQGKRVPLLLGKIGVLGKAFITGLARQSAGSFKIGGTDMNKDEKKSGKIKVVYGCCAELDMAGWPLDRIRVALREFIDIGSDIDVFLDGKRVSAGSRKVEAGQVLAFFHDGLKE